ncbi:MAG: hypothetical protein ACI8S6_003816 [Myxococcota bacterium]|jgi:hypothetical protein
MVLWVLTALLSVANAGEADDAAALLSRFPAGRVPGSEPVMTAIMALQDSGGPEHLGVLASLQEYEQSPVREAASGALLIVTLRARLQRREAYTAPDNRDVRRWLEAHPGLLRTDGTPIGVHESEAIAYAVLALGGPQQVWARMPTVLVQEGEKREDATDLEGALTRYAFAATHDHPQARALLGAFDLDVERLLLGLTADSTLLTVPPAEALDTLIVTGGSQTVTVLIERSRSSNEITQVQALDALAEMIRRGQLTVTARRAARHRLEVVTSDGHEPLRVFAQTVLSDLEPVE